MNTKTKNTGTPGMEIKELTPPMTINMKKLVAGVGTVFSGVIQMLEALEPQAAEQLLRTAFGGSEANDRLATNERTPDENNAISNDAAALDRASEDAAKAEPVKVEQKTQQTVTAAQEAASQNVTVDDITRIIVRKVKQDRSNNEKIGSILKTYGVAKVSELPAAKYEAFLTDISQL